MMIIDISQTLRPDLPMWPGEAPCEGEVVAKISANCPVNVSRILMSAHSGTHADSPFHYDDNGLSSSECELSPYIGECQVVDVSHAVGVISLDSLSNDFQVTSQRVLFRSYDRFPHTKWDPNFKAICPDLIRYLAKKKVKLVGTDTPSLDPQESKTLCAHQAVKESGMRILEGLVLEHVDEGNYELIALPLKLEKSDASPVRAILIKE